MLSEIRRRLGSRQAATPRVLDDAIDSIVQMFENSRPGLGDATLHDPRAVAGFLTELYEREAGGVRERIATRQLHLEPAARDELFQRVDQHLRRVLIPAYARLAARFTRRERNDFYWSGEAWHAAERLACGAGGLALGALVVWAPFIPLWSKEWVLIFAAGGLVFPGLRRFLAMRRYEAEINRLVARAEHEVWRMDLAYLTSPASLGLRSPDAEAPAGAADEGQAAGADARTRRIQRIEGGR